MATKWGDTMLISITKRTVCLCVLLCAGAAAVLAQDAMNEQLARFRTALETGDYATADSALAAALEAAEAASNTQAAVQLAYTLATIRFDLGRAGDAHAPAVRALEIARANPGFGIDPLAAELWVARAEAALGQPDATTRLQNAIAQAQARPDLQGTLYPSVASLGAAQIARGDYDGAIKTWEMAESLADAAPSPPVARAQALTSKAVAVFLGGVDRTKGSAGEVRDRALRVRDDLEAAKRLLRPTVEENHGDIPVELARQAYAETLAWEAAFNQKVQADGITIPPKNENAREFEYSAVSGDRLCDVRFSADPQPVFMQTGGVSGNMSAAVVEFELDDRGRTTDRRIIASIPPNGTYAQSISEVVEHWFASSSTGRRCVSPKRVYWTGAFIVR